jgi:ribosomal protein S18 acetylase RimI-like enzyme
MKTPKSRKTTLLDEAVGFIFSRTWGKVGWFGTFSVLPKFQGQGIGQQLVAASINYLHESGVRVIGLETIPESPYNLNRGLYHKTGFRSRLLTFLLTKSLNDSIAKVELPCWSSANPQMPVLKNLRKLLA